MTAVFRNLISLVKGKFIKDAGIYLITSVVGSLAGFLLLPVLTKYLAPEDYGMVSLFGVYLFFATTVIQFNFGTAVNRQYFNKTVDLKIYLANCLFICTIIAGSMLLILLVMRGQLAGIPDFSEILALGAIINAYIGIFPAAAIVLFLIKREAKAFAGIQLFQRFFDLGLAILLVVALKMGWEGRVLSSIYAAALAAVGALYVLRSEVRWKVNWHYMKDALIFGAPLVPLSFSNFAMSAVDKITISSLVSLHELGIYAVAVQLASVIGLLIGSLANVWTPWAYAKMEEPDEAKAILIVKASYAILAALIITALAATAIIPYILPLVTTKAYGGATQYMIWLALGNVFQGLSGSIIGFQMMYFRKTGLASTLMMSVALFNVAATYLLVRSMGAIGAAQAFFLSNLLMMALAWYVSNRIYRLPWFFWYKRSLE